MQLDVSAAKLSCITPCFQIEQKVGNKRAI